MPRRTRSMRSHSRHALPAVLLVALAALVAGCGKGTQSTSPGTTPMTQDSADDLALNTVAALNVVGGDVSVSAGAAAGSPAPQAALRPEGSARPTVVLS